VPRLEWNKKGERFFETGLDRGVFYPDDAPGVPWNGLTSVNETPDGGDANSYYLDGQKYLDIINPEDFAGTLEALSCPPEFLPYDGMARFLGLTITGQPRRKFGLAYRTLIGNDTQAAGFEYKIHLVYEAKVLPSSRNRTTIGDSVEVMPNSWSLVATPVGLPNRRKTAHYVVDTRDNMPERIAILEDYLYGNDELNPQLLPPQEVSNILAYGSRILSD
jgi:hypothetical protein